MSDKERLSASVDADLLEVGRAAVQSGSAASLSAWVNDAMRLKAQHDRRMAALGAFVEAYEAEHGVIEEQEMEAASRRARARATVVRSAPKRRSGA